MSEGTDRTFFDRGIGFSQPGAGWKEVRSAGKKIKTNNGRNLIK